MVDLKYLTIGNIRTGGLHQDQSRRVGSVLHGHVDAIPKCLRSLNLKDVTQSLYILSWLSGSAFDLGGLTELRLTSRTVGAGIKHLLLDLGSCQPYGINHMLNYYISTAALKSFTALETLDIHIRSESPHIPNDASCLGDIHRLLHCVMFAKLWKICITMRFILHTAKDYPYYQDLPFWTDLDDLLGSPNFPSLLRVVFIIEIDDEYWCPLRTGYTIESLGSDSGEPENHHIPPEVTEHPGPADPPTMDDVSRHDHKENADCGILRLFGVSLF
ncbi:hypothetical protein EV421DRAFT_1896383 [Armillaria borealis]|uniref:Uncharacterized protein n=1 Tax=Armillaria borealis TaxID=47425 RepID=A0AA39K4K1_9AGAR|nr:hypothetical protein EV421DRAFT_1896383 [Armillaria borealis]